MAHLMDRIDRWRLAEELTAYQIALLMAGYDPTDVSPAEDGSWPIDIYREIDAFLTAVQHAVRSSSIDANISDIPPEGPSYIDWDDTPIDVLSLKSWIKKRGFHDKFLATDQQQNINSPENPSSPFYSSKLDAAVQAWQAVSSAPNLLRGKSPKQALEAWLTENAARFGLIRPDGSPNKQGIEEVAKVANWKPHGGATPTPASELTHSFQATGGQVQQNPPTPDDNTLPYDKDIPF